MISYGLTWLGASLVMLAYQKIMARWRTQYVLYRVPNEEPEWRVTWRGDPAPVDAHEAYDQLAEAWEAIQRKSGGTSKRYFDRKGREIR